MKSTPCSYCQAIREAGLRLAAAYARGDIEAAKQAQETLIDLTKQKLGFRR